MEADVVIIGAGIAGLSAAWRLALIGRDVVVLEQFEIGNRHGSSHGAVRIFRFAYADPFYVGLAQAALPLWRELESVPEEILRVTGGLDAGAPEFIDPIADALESRGAAVERLTSAERIARFPWLVAGAAGGVFSPDTGVIDAERALARTADAARILGARILEHAPVRGITPRADTVILETPSGSVRARFAVVAAGAWAAPVLEPLGIRLPLRVTREQVLYAGGSLLPDTPFIHYGDIHRYGVPLAGSARGLKLGEHGSGSLAVPETGTGVIDEAGAERLKAYAAAALPSLETTEVTWETCLYTSTPSQDFVIDAREGLVVASPCSGHGFKFGPLTGEIIARLATGRAPVVEMGRFALTSFS